MNRRTLRMWLRPGMKVKRWVALFMLAVVLIALGLAMGAAWAYDNIKVPGFLQGLAEILTLQFLPRIARAVVVIGLAIGLLLYAVRRLSHSVLGPLLALEPTGRGVAEIVHHDRFGKEIPDFNVVAIGGGTGLSALLRGLKLADVNLTAIVTVADDGGSTGKIRDVYDIPAPGDIRNCLVALADDESTMGTLFNYRFDRDGSELSGHSFGNLFITAMTQVSGSFEQAVIESARVLNVRGRVLPSTLENVTLCADLVDGSRVRGESTIAHEKPAISRIFLEPDSPNAYEPALAAILNADLIVLGPGSLYTSVLPNLLVDGIREAIRWSSASTMYACNVATQQGETDHYGYKQHIEEIVQYLGEGELDFALVNSNPASASAIRPELEVEAVVYDGATDVSGVRIVARDLLSDRNPLRHDPAKLASILLELAREHRLKFRNLDEFVVTADPPHNNVSETIHAAP